MGCLLLDISGPGEGGPDFHLGDEQFTWLDEELAAAGLRSDTVAIFMHSYPADLPGDGEAERVAATIAHNGVALVDLGHTQYNELANEGRRIIASTRSNGKIEEGSVGDALTTIDDGRVSWRFKLLEPFPYVNVTTPADHRLVRDPDQIPRAQSTCMPSCSERTTCAASSSARRWLVADDDYHRGEQPAPPHRRAGP